MELHNAVKKYGSINAAAKELGIPPTTFRRRLDQEKRDSITSFTLPDPIVYKADNIRHFIISAAQDKTTVHEDFLNNLKAYAKYLDAEILIGGFTYSKKLFIDNDPRVRSDDVWFDESLDEYIIHDRVELGDNILFCAEMNTLPTAVQPLSGLETYTKSKWGIFPHAKVQLRSIATMMNSSAKQIMTTGAVTLPNYIRRKAGVKAEFHHIIGAVVVSLYPDGAFFCRHIHAKNLTDGSFYDLNRYISNGKVEDGHRPDALVHGDIHIEKIDPEVALTTWGYDVNSKTIKFKQDSLTALLNPKHRIFHDLIDFSSRNHHNVFDHHFRIKAYFHGRDNVKDDIKEGVDFLNLIADQDIKDIVIQSNHDNALIKWLKNPEVRNDPENYEFWLECELKYVKSLKYNMPCFLFSDIMYELGVSKEVEFIPEDSTFIINDVELAIHGHYGANGARGSAAAFNKMGPKSITGHTHSPSITDGHMCVGTNSLMDMDYNKGLSSWAHTNAILYPNGHRTLITMSNGRWF